MGPLVVAGVVIAPQLVDRLRAMGVRDSKTLAPAKRSSLHAFLTSCSDVAWASTHITSAEIDLRRRRHETLNDIEASAMLALAKRLYKQTGFDELQIDSVEANTARFELPFQTAFASVKVVAQCGADATFVSVSAASIVAKVERDLAMQEIELQEGRPVGSGYPGDAVTKQFLHDYYQANGHLPSYVRHTWKLQQPFQQQQKERVSE